MQLCAHHNLFLVSTNYLHSHRRCVNCRPTSASQAWNQIDQIAVSYRWCGFVQDYRFFGSTYVDSDYAPVRANLTLRFSCQQTHRSERIDVRKLEAVSIATKYHTELGSRVAIIIKKSTDMHWLQLHDAMRMAGKASSYFAERPGTSPQTPYNSPKPVGLLQVTASLTISDDCYIKK